MTNRVSMNLTDEELALIAQLRCTFKLSTNIGTVVQALKITGLIAEKLQTGKNLAVLDSRGFVEATIHIPGLSTNN